MTTIRITGAALDREPVDPGPGIHLWSLMTAFQVSEETVRLMAQGQDPGDIHMDTENLMMAPELGCYKCEQPYSRYLFHRKCTGSLEVQP
jgi:hypothetical protein